MSKTLLGVLAVVGILALWVVSSYNSLVNLEENVDNSFAKIETQYQRRFDLIPNIIETVKGSAAFEKSTLEAVTAARSAWAQAGSNNDKIGAANSFDSALSRLLVTVEAYPDIKSTAAFRDLTTELEGTENRIAFARNEYNDTATSYNKTTRLFPKNLIASLFGFDAEKALFAATAGAEDAVKVDFGSLTAPTTAQ
jgi:LemA protein